MAKLVVTKKENGEFRFSLLNDKSLPIISSKAFSTKTACLNGVEMLKASVTIPSNIEKMVGGKGKPYFNIKTEQIASLAKSGLFDNEKQREACIQELLTELPKAALEYVKIAKKEEPKPLPNESKGQNDIADFMPKRKPKKKSHYN